MLYGDEDNSGKRRKERKREAGSGNGDEEVRKNIVNVKEMISVGFDGCVEE